MATFQDLVYGYECNYECLGGLSILYHIYAGASLFLDMNNAKLGYLWDPEAPAAQWWMAEATTYIICNMNA